MRLKMKFGKDLSVYAGSDFLGKTIGIVTSPLLTRYLTPEQFGAYPLLLAVWSILQWIQYSGMETSFQFYRAQRLDEASRREILSTCTYIAVFSVMTIWILFCVVEWATHWLQSYAQVSHLEVMAFLLGLGPMGIVGWHLIVLRFGHQPESFAKLNLISRVLGPGLASVVIMTFAQSQRLFVFLGVISVSQIVSVYLSLREMNKNLISPYEKKFLSRSLGKEMTTYGMMVVPGAVLYSLVTLVDRLMLGWWSGVEQVALFALASTIGAIALTLKSWFSLVYNPHLIDWLATKNPDVYVPRLQNLAIFVSLIFFPLAALLCFWSRPIIEFIYPPFYIQAAELIPWIALTCAYSMISMVAIATSFITRAPIMYFVVNLIALFINVLIGWMLIPKMGAKGAVIGTAAAELAILISWVFLGLSRKNLPLRWGSIVLVSLAGTIVVAFYRPGYLIPDQIWIENILASVLIISISLVTIVRCKPQGGWKAALLT